MSEALISPESNEPEIFPPPAASALLNLEEASRCSVRPDGVYLAGQLDAVIAPILLAKSPQKTFFLSLTSIHEGQ